MLPRRIHLLAWLLVIAGVVAGLSVLAFRTREPEYEGKNLSEWVLMVSQPSLDDVLRSMVSVSYHNPFESQPAANAIRHIGPVAVPYLLRWSRYEAPPWKVKLSWLLNATVFHSKPRGIQVDEKLKERAVKSMHALMALGPDAAAAIPELSKRVIETNYTAGTIYSAQCLAAIGALGLPSLLQALTNAPTPTIMRCRIASNIRAMGPNATPAIPVLETYLQNPNPQVRNVATNLLKALQYIRESSQAELGRKSLFL